MYFTHEMEYLEYLSKYHDLWILRLFVLLDPYRPSTLYKKLMLLAIYLFRILLNQEIYRSCSNNLIHTSYLKLCARYLKKILEFKI